MDGGIVDGGDRLADRGFYFAADDVGFVKREIRIGLDVEVDEVVDAKFPDAQFFNREDARYADGCLLDLRNDGPVWHAVHEVVYGGL